MSQNKLALLSNENEDFISQLPEPILHYILSFLSCNKEFARTCVLSKTWRNVYYSRPNMVFEEKDFSTTRESHIISLEGRSMFLHYVDQSLTRRIEMNSNHLDNFELNFVFCKSYDMPKSNDINLILEKVSSLCVKTLSVKLCYFKKLSPLVLDCNTLVKMHLLGLCFIKACKTISIPNLKVLSLELVDLKNEVLENLIYGCPCLQILSLGRCHTAETLHLLGLTSLVELTVSACTDVKKVEINSLFFHNLVIEENYWSNNSIIVKLGFETMKKLEVSYKGAFIKDRIGWISDELSAFRELTELSLISRLIKGKICSRSIKKLVISHCRVETKTLEIDCPNLLSLEYEANDMFFNIVSKCVLQDFRFQFSILESEAKSEQIHALKNLVGSTFISTKNLKVVIVLGDNKDIFILEGLNKLMLSILNKVDDGLKPLIFITSHSIDWDAIMPTSSSVTSLSLNLVSLSDSTFSKDIWENLLCLEELQPKKYANLCCVKKDCRNESIPIDLLAHEGSKYEMTRILLEFDWPK